MIGLTGGVGTLGVAGVVAPMLTERKTKCRVCGESNDVGNAQPYKGPLSKCMGKKCCSGRLA